VNPAGGIELATSRGGARADLKIGIPPVNVLDSSALAEISRCVLAARAARVLVLSGLPAAFSAGVDVAEHVPEPERIETMLAAMRDVLTALVETPSVTVAAVSGACLGGGAEIVASCDVVVVAENARVGFPEIGLGCFPPGGVALLPSRIGEARAADWILSGRVVSGREAERAGFAAQAVSSARLEAETERLVESLLSRGTAALSAARDLLRQGRRDALQNRLAAAERAYRALAGDTDLARAVAKFETARRR